MSYEHEPEDTAHTAAHPWSDDAEKGLLSCVVQDPENLLHSVRAKVPVEAFYRESHRLIYARLLAMAETRIPIDLISLTNALREKGELDKVGGPAATADLWTFVAVVTHWDFYTRIVLEKYRLRQAMALCQKILGRAKSFGQAEDETDSSVVLAEAETGFFDLLQQSSASSHGGTMHDAKHATDAWLTHMEQVIDNRGKINGLTTGLHELDLIFHGLVAKETMVIAARPAMGKTALAVSMADHMAIDNGWPGLIFSAEMSVEQVYTRLVLGKAGINTRKGNNGMFSEREKGEMVKVARQVRKAPLWINDSSYITTADIRAQAQLAKRQHGLKWIMVDHLHLIKGVSAASQKDERMRLVEVMETLQFCKKEFDLVVIVLVQMSRESDRKAGQPPVLADLSGSAAIEQYADHVLFIHRPDEYVKWHRVKQDAQDAWRKMIQPRRERSPDLWSDGLAYADDEGGFARQDYEEQAILYVRKNRRGPTPEVQVRYQATLTRFSTRMPSLYSNHPLDQQMGTYAPSTSSKAHTPTKVKPRSDHGDDDDDFYRD
jgi:replicative DNA helicase